MDHNAADSYKDAMLMTEQVDQDLSQASRVSLQSPEASELLGRLKSRTAELASRLLALSRDDPPPQMSSTLWMTKVRALERRLDEQRGSMNVFEKRMMQFREREYPEQELFGGRRRGDQPEVVVDRMRLENARLTRTSEELSQLTEAAQDAFNTVMEQGRLLRGSNRKIEEFRGHVGIASGLLKTMTRRVLGDKWTLRVGGAVVLVVFVMLLWWRSKR